ncbi:helix-turn-helix transcriptional regulator [Paludibacter sp.]|uniref:helix-turn-helix domain-containing protein n=1 Tax=Paludibacter sp. TaxID=1898105 RepID=UPI0013535386|nr:helix-turn-helix transcriptional regulator [Paludibacter sp.]MTK52995.1 helix-turn-helix transcriptional regulator [Paludibacter sp.]
MTREELICSPGYIITKIQMDLFDQVSQYLKENGNSQTKLAEKLGVSKGYISQILNGNYDHRISKLVELSLAVGIIPTLSFQSKEQYIIQDCLVSQCASPNDIESCRNYLHSNGYFTYDSNAYCTPINKQEEKLKNRVA